jgi:hypothetical protein
MATRFRPSDPDAARQRFAAIRARAFERVAEEERQVLAKLARDRRAEKAAAESAAAPAAVARRDEEPELADADSA